MSEVHGGRVHDYAEASGRRIDQIVDFSANINALGPPQSVLAAMEEALLEVQHYPDVRQRCVKETLVRALYLRDESGLFCGNGAAEVIDLMVRTIHPGRIFVFQPAFTEYEATAHRCRVPVEHLSLLRDQPFDLATAVNRGDKQPNAGDMVIFNNPHNPTGHCWSRDQLVTLIHGLTNQGVFTVVDESFMDFRRDEGQLTVIPLIDQIDRLLVVRSATKMYAIPGVRFGFGVANASIVSTIEEHRDGWSVNHIAQRAAAAAYEDELFRYKTWQWLQVEQGFVQSTWGSHPGLKLWPVGVNYFLFRIANTDVDPDMLYGRLASEGLFIRRCGNFRELDDSCFRVAIKTRSDNERLWQAVSRLLDEHG